MDVERVDFVSVLTQDIPRAKRFHSEVLGLPIESEGEHDLEFTAGQITLDVFDPSSIGQQFAPSPAGIALSVPDVAAAKAKLESGGLQVNEMWDSGVCQGAGLRDPDGNAILLHHRYAR